MTKFAKEDEVIDKKDARVLFNFNDKGEMSDLIVAEFARGDRNNWPMHLYKYYNSDFGNCNSTWDKWSNEIILLRLFFAYEFENNGVKDKALSELSKIRELRKEIIVFGKGPFYQYHDGEDNFENVYL